MCDTVLWTDSWGREKRVPLSWLGAREIKTNAEHMRLCIGNYTTPSQLRCVIPPSLAAEFDEWDNCSDEALFIFGAMLDELPGVYGYA